MIKEEIIEMARQAGAMFDHITWVERDLLPVFERFAKFIAEHEREACAKVCDVFADDEYATGKFLAMVIRSRGQE